MKHIMHLIRPTRFNLLILCYWLQCHLASATLLSHMPQPQAQMQQQQQTQQNQQVQTQSLLQQPQQPASTLLLPPTTTSQITSALENNGTLAQALAQMFAQQQQQANAAASSSGAPGSAYGTQAPNSNQYVIKFIQNDPKSNLALVSIMPVNNTNLHEPRIELRYQSRYPFVSLDEKSSNNTLVAAVLVTDEDSGPNGETSVSLEQGNELGHFKLVNTQFSRTILVNGSQLLKARQPEYNLTIVARDHGSPSKSSSVNLVIKLNASSQSGFSLPSEVSPNSLKPPVTDLMYVGAMLVVIFSALIFIIIIGCALVQRPKNMKGPPPRATSATNSRLHPSEHCRCVNLTNL